MSTEAEQKLEIRITRVEGTLGRVEEEIMDMKEIYGEIRSVVLSVNSLASEVRYMREEQCKTTKRVDRIELKPSQKWDKLMDLIMGAIVGGLIGFLLTKLFL